MKITKHRIQNAYWSEHTNLAFIWNGSLLQQVPAETAELIHTVLPTSYAHDQWASYSDGENWTGRISIFLFYIWSSLITSFCGRRFPFFRIYLDAVLLFISFSFIFTHSLILYFFMFSWIWVLLSLICQSLADFKKCIQLTNIKQTISVSSIEVRRDHRVKATLLAEM